jgi:hypothetical protein
VAAGVVVVDELAQAVESEKTAAGEGKKEEIVMRRGGKCKGKASKVVNREQELVGGQRAKLAQAALERFSDNRTFAVVRMSGKRCLS